jgi:hypothetical protein
MAPSEHEEEVRASLDLISGGKDAFVVEVIYTH